MPRRGLLCACGFDQGVVVVQAHLFALHQLCRGFGNGRVENEFTVFGYVLPIAEVFKKPTWVVAATGGFGARAGFGNVFVYAAGQEFYHFRLNQAAYHHHAIAGKIADQLRIYFKY